MESESTFTGTLKMEDWLPDGENGDEYPSPKGTTSSEWAWEFLRRNREYQKFYEDYLKEYEKLCTKEEATFSQECLEKLTILHQHAAKQYSVHLHPWGLPDPSLSFEDQPANRPLFGQDKPWGIYMNPIKGEDGENRCLVGSFGEDTIPFLIKEMNRDLYEVNEGLETMVTIEPMKLHIEIALDASIPDQMRIISKYAREKQRQLIKWELVKKSKQIEGKHMLARLRAWDAEFILKSEGEKDYKIMIHNTLYPGTEPGMDRRYCKAVDQRLSEAKKYIAGGYKKLI